MAKAIEKLENGLSIRYLVKAEKYYITRGVTHILINNNYSVGFDSFDKAKDVATKLIKTYHPFEWI